MKKLNKTTFLSMLGLSFGILMISSCKQADDFEIYDTWKVTSAEFNPAVDISGTMVTDAYPYMFANPCDQDNLDIFEENGTYIRDEGATKCDAADPQQETGTFTLSGTTVTILIGSDTIVLNDLEITETTLKGSVLVGFGSNSANVDMTMARQ